MHYKKLPLAMFVVHEADSEMEITQHKFKGVSHTVFQ